MENSFGILLEIDRNILKITGFNKDTNRIYFSVSKEVSSETLFELGSNEVCWLHHLVDYALDANFEEELERQRMVSESTGVDGFSDES